MATTWTLDIDLNSDGDFSDSNEALFSYVRDMQWNIGFMKPFRSVPGESVLQATLINTDGRFNPENSSSPLYGSLTAGKLMRVTANGTDLWRGYLDSIDPEWRVAADQTGKTYAQLRAVGVRQVLQEHLLNLPLQQNKYADEIIREVLGHVIPPAAIPAGVWVLDVAGKSEIDETTILGDIADLMRVQRGYTQFGYYGDIRALDKDDYDESGGREQSAWRVVRDLADADHLRIIPGDRSGRFVVWNRNYLRDNITVAATIEAGAGGDEKPSAVNYRYDKDRINRASITYFQRTDEQLEVTLWEMQDTTVLQPGGRLIQQVYLRDDNEALAGATNLRLDTLWSTHGVVNGGGGVATLKLINETASALPVTGVSIIGDVIESHDKTTVVVEDKESVTSFRRKAEKRITTRAEITYLQALNWCDYVLQARKDTFGLVEYVELLNKADDTENSFQLTRTLGDRIGVTLGNGHDKEAHIIGEWHRVSDAGKVHQTRFYLEPATVSNGARYDSQFVSADVSIGKTSNADRLAQSFTVSRACTIKHVRLWLRTVGSPTDKLQVVIQGDSAGSPDDSTITNGKSAQVDLSDTNIIHGDYQWITFTFSTAPSLSASTTYWIVLEAGDANLVSHWRLEETSGTRADAWGTNPLTDNNTVTSTTGVQGTAALFDVANSEYLSITDAAQTGLGITTSSFTVVGWLHLNDVPSITGSIMYVFSKDQAAGSNYSYRVLVNATDKLVFQVSSDGTSHTSILSGTLTVSTTYFFAVRWDGSNIKLRLDTTDSTPVAFTGPLNASTAPFLLGSISAAPQLTLDGWLDEIGFYDRELTDAELTTLRNSGSGLVWHQASLFKSADNYVEWGADDERVPIATNLVDAFTFDSQDSPGASHTGNNDMTQNGTVTQPPASGAGPTLNKPYDTQGLFGLCARFDGASSLERADNAAFSVTGQLTICGWFQAYASGSEMDVIAKWLTTGDQRSYKVTISSSNQLEFSVSSAGTAATVSTVTNTTTLVSHNWYWFMARYDGTNIELRINDGAFAQTAFAAGIFDSTAPLVIGASGDGTANYYTGLQDEVGVWDTAALTDANADFIYNSGQGRQLFEWLAYGNGQMKSLASGSWTAETKDAAFEARIVA